VLLLATQAEPQMLAFEHPNLGRLVQPRHFPRIAETAARGVPWAADNDCFQGLDRDAFVRMLDRLAGLPGCHFVTLPDVVADARATARAFSTWYWALVDRDLPPALVAQDGIYELGVPWQMIAGVFIGGSTEFKYGEVAYELAREAKRRHKWVHMGRVNSAKGIAYAKAIGCDSVDGTKWVRWRDTYLAEGLQLVSAPPQLALGADPEAIAR